VPLVPCSVCRERPADKLAQVTFAWSPQPRERVAYRQRLCLGCFAGRVLTLDKPIEPTGPLTCPACGIDSEKDMEPVYATAFVPGVGKMTYEWPLCPTHAAVVREAAKENAELLPERDPESRGLAPRTAPQTSAWAALGIVPRE
jgi:hypothetical protein